MAAAPRSPSNSTRSSTRSPPHLAPAGSEDIRLQGARIALADGPYTPSEHQTLAAVGRALLLSHEDTERLLAIAARTPS